MLIEYRRPLEIASPRRGNLAVLPRTLTLLVLAACLRQGPASVAATQGEAAKTGSEAKVADEPSGEKKSSSPKTNGDAKLSYNDGTAEGKKSIGGSGEMINFELPGDEGKVAAIRIHASRYGYPQPPQENFTISVLNDDMSEVVATQLAPYSLFKRGPESWVQVKFPKPVAVPKKFWIVLDFHAGKTKGVYVSYDTSTLGKHSRVGLPGMGTQETDFGADWMIEAVLAK